MARDPSVGDDYNLPGFPTQPPSTPPARNIFQAGRLYVVGEVVEPAVENGYVYEVTVGGYSGTSEPVWPLTPGATVVSGAVTFTCRTKTTVTWTAVPLWKSGAVEPVWPTTIGGTVTDNGITWTCRAPNITDRYCPNSKQVLILASKVWAGDDDVTRYCATNDPTDWTSANDAGFLPTGLQAVGEQECSALGPYRGNLCVWTPSTLQVWEVDADPANNQKLDAFEGLGTTYARGAAAVANDLYFISALGVRSVSISAGSTSLESGDVGAPIDPLIQSMLAGYSDPIGIYYANAGQYIVFLGDEAVVFTRSTVSGTACWSRWTLPWVVEDAALLGGKLYVRSGDTVFLYDENAFADQTTAGATVIFDTVVWWPWLDFGAIGTTKMMIGMDYIGLRPVTIEFGYDQDNPAAFTAPYAIDRDTVPGGIIPFPLAAPSISPRITHSANEEWDMDALVLYLADFRMTA